MHWAPFTTLPSTLFKLNPPPAGRSNLFNRSDPPPSDHEKTDEKLVDKFLWYSVCHHMGIKDFSPKQASFCEYTREVIVCMMITGKGRSGLDIWPKTPNQNTSTEDMIFITCYKEAIKQTKINPQQNHLLGLSAKKAYYASYTNSYLKNNFAYPVINT